MADRQVGVTVPHLRAWRLHALLKQGELAKSAKVSRFTVQRAERGEAVSIDSVRAIAAALSITPEQLRYQDPEVKEGLAP